MNEAKEQVLDEMMGDVERAVAGYRDDCNAELTSRTYIYNYVAAAVEGKVHDNHLTHAISRAGMQNTGHRVKINKAWHSVVIVRGDYTVAKVKKASGPALVDIIEGKSHPDHPEHPEHPM
jgi:hypothetical protein